MGDFIEDQGDDRDARRDPAQSSPDYTPFPGLPFELVLCILEVAARLSTRTGLAISLVSKAVHDCVAPIIYRTVILHKEIEVERFHGATHIPACDHVRNLSLFDRDHQPDIGLEIIKRCQHLARLVLTDWHECYNYSGETWHEPLWEVIVTNLDRSWLMPRMTMSSVTHFYWGGWIFHNNALDIWQALPRLTHFGYFARGHISMDPEDGDSEHWLVWMTKLLLSSNPSLEMVILRAAFRPRYMAPDVKQVWVQLAGITDERLLVRPGVRDREFNELLLSGRTIWDNARQRYGDWRHELRV